MEYTLSMVFITTNGEKTTISISDVKENLTQADAITLMDKIIEKDVFFTKNGSLVEKYSAQVVQRAVTKFTLS